MKLEEIIDYVFRGFDTILTWPVIFLFLLFILRKQIPPLFQRLSNVEFGKLKVGFKQPKSTNTPIGKTNVSALPTIPESDSHSFYSHKYSFRISWPLHHWRFVPNPAAVMENMGMPNYRRFAFIVEWHKDIGGFRPNINIMVDYVGETSLKDYLAKSMGDLEALNCEIQLYRIDEKTNGAILVSIRSVNDAQLYHIARLTTYAGLAFVVTATANNKDLPIELKAEMSAVLNSFEIVHQ